MANTFKQLKYVFPFVLLLAVQRIKAQDIKISDIQNVDSVNTQDMYRMMNLLGMDIRKYAISSKFKDYYCNLIVEEYQKGKLVSTFNSRNEIGKINEWVIKVGNNLEKSQFPIAFYTQEYQDTLVKVNTHVGELEYNKKLVKQKGLSYTWKQVYDIKDYTHKIVPFEKYPLIAYTSAVNQAHAKTKGASEFCLINGELIQVERWYQVLGIQHFYIYYLSFEK